MKKVILAVVCCFATLQLSACNGAGDKPIKVEQLPATAQSFLTEHFSGQQVSFVLMDTDVFDKDYKVVFANGWSAEFDKSGEWTSVDCERKAIPTGIAPRQISDYIAENHPTNYIIEIERTSRHYEIGMNNGLEIKFDKKFNVVEYDD